MIADPCDPLRRAPNTLDMAHLGRLTEPVHQMLSELVSRCSSESATTTMACASLVVSLHQLRGNMLSKHVPSLILLNAGEAAPDPVDEFVRGFVHEEKAKRPGVQKSPMFDSNP